MTALTDLTAVVTQQTGEVDIGLPWPELAVVTLMGGVADIIDVLVAAEQAEGDLASLTSAMGTLTTELRAQSGAVANAVSTHTRPIA